MTREAAGAIAESGVARPTVGREPPKKRRLPSTENLLILVFELFYFNPSAWIMSFTELISWSLSAAGSLSFAALSIALMICISR